MTAMPYPSIWRATLLVALDNGGINRERSERQQRRDLRCWLKQQPQEILPAIDEWFAGLTDEEMEDFCCGGEGEPEKVALQERAPPFADDLLNRYFDEVC